MTVETLYLCKVPFESSEYIWLSFYIMKNCEVIGTIIDGINDSHRFLHFRSKRKNKTLSGTFLSYMII